MTILADTRIFYCCWFFRFEFVKTQDYVLNCITRWTLLCWIALHVGTSTLLCYNPITSGLIQTCNARLQGERYKVHTFTSLYWLAIHNVHNYTRTDDAGKYAEDTGKKQQHLTFSASVRTDLSVIFYLRVWVNMSIAMRLASSWVRFTSNAWVSHRQCMRPCLTYHNTQLYKIFPQQDIRANNSLTKPFCYGYCYYNYYSGTVLTRLATMLRIQLLMFVPWSPPHFKGKGTATGFVLCGTVELYQLQGKL